MRCSRPNPPLLFLWPGLRIRPPSSEHGNVPRWQSFGSKNLLFKHLREEGSACGTQAGTALPPVSNKTEKVALIFGFLGDAYSCGEVFQERGGYSALNHRADVGADTIDTFYGSSSVEGRILATKRA